MKATLKVLIGGFGGVAFAWSGLGSISETQLQSYQLIPERNAFGLKPPPPPIEVTNNQPPPAAKVTFTGITGNSSGKRAYFMIPDLKSPGVFSYPILREGEQEGTLKVMESGIDEKNGTVKILNGGVAMTLSFEKDGNKAVGGPAVAGAVGGPAVPGALPHAMPGVNPALRIPPPPGVIPRATASMALPTPSATVNTASIRGGSQNTIPTRSIRTQPVAPQPLMQQTAEESIINMEVQRALNAEQIAAGQFPPLPPTPLSDGGGPPALPGMGGK